VGAVATPPAVVVAVTKRVFVPANVPLAPVAGAVKVTVRPATAGLTVTENGTGYTVLVRVD
jgi:hypothetical protein